MSRENIEFLVSTKIPSGEIASTIVRREFTSSGDPGALLAEALNEARKNIASRQLDYDSFKSDSAYLDALDAIQETVSILDLAISHDETKPLAWHFVRAHLSDEDRRIFVRNLQANNRTAAQILMIWDIAKRFYETTLPSEEFDDFLSAVEIADIDWIPADAQVLRSYLVESPAGTDVPVEFLSPKSASMADDVAHAFLLAAAIDPTIDPTQYTAISKAGTSVRYYIEADYNDGDDFRDWVEAVDTDEAEFLAAVTVQCNQSGAADDTVINDLGYFIEAVSDIKVTTTYPDPVTKDEIVTAVRTMLSAYDSKNGLDEAVSKLRDMVAVI